MLAVNVNKRITNFPQLRHGRGRAVYPCFAPPLVVDLTPQHQRRRQFGGHRRAAGIVKPIAGQPVGQRGRAAQLNRYLAASGTVTNHRGLRALTQGNLHGIDQNRFPRAGLAG